MDTLNSPRGFVKGLGSTAQGSPRRQPLAWARAGPAAGKCRLFANAGKSGARLLVKKGKFNDGKAKSIENNGSNPPESWEGFRARKNGGKALHRRSTSWGRDGQRRHPGQYMGEGRGYLMVRAEPPSRGLCVAISRPHPERVSKRGPGAASLSGKRSRNAPGRR